MSRLSRLKGFLFSISGENSKGGCLLLLFAQATLLLSLIFMGFIIIHLHLPHYNEKRLSSGKGRGIMCSTRANEFIPGENCELHWDKRKVTVKGRAEGVDQEVVELDEAAETSRVLRVKAKGQGQGRSGTGENSATPEPLYFERIPEERHFTWSSCGEFCSSVKVEERGCRQLRVDARIMGTDLLFQGCSDSKVSYCPFLDLDRSDSEMLNKFPFKEAVKCEENECLKSSIFKCFAMKSEKEKGGSSTLQNSTVSAKSSLTCAHIEKFISCNMPKLDEEDGYFIKKFNCRNKNITGSCLEEGGPGVYVCDSESWCRRISNPTKVCSRFCGKMGFGEVNLVATDPLFQRIITANCTRAFRDGAGSRRIEVWPAGIKHKDSSSKWVNTPQLLVTCGDLGIGGVNSTEFKFSDCFNATRLENSTLPPSLSLKELRNLWYENLRTEDFHLDAIFMKDAPPLQKLLIGSNLPLYRNDYYGGNGCNGVNSKKEVTQNCEKFYSIFGQLEGDFKGPSNFPCHCRNVGNVGMENYTFCVVARDENENLVKIEGTWEEGLVDFLGKHEILILTLVSILFLVSLGVVGGLLWPLMVDLEESSRRMVAVGVGEGQEGGSRRSSFRSKREGFVMRGKQSSVRSISGNSNLSVM